MPDWLYSWIHPRQLENTIRMVEAGGSAQLSSEHLPVVKARTWRNMHENSWEDPDVGEDKNSSAWTGMCTCPVIILIVFLQIYGVVRRWCWSLNVNNLCWCIHSRNRDLVLVRKRGHSVHWWSSVQPMPYFSLKCSWCALLSIYLNVSQE